MKITVLWSDIVWFDTVTWNLHLSIRKKFSLLYSERRRKPHKLSASASSNSVSQNINPQKSSYPVHINGDTNF